MTFTFCELPVPLSTTIILFLPWTVYIGLIQQTLQWWSFYYFARLITYCIYWLKSIPCILKFEHIPLKSVYSDQRRSKPQYSLWPPFSLLVRLFASITQRKFWIFILLKMHFSAFQASFAVATKYDFRTAQICL